MTKLMTVAELALREMLRRRTVLVILLLLPRIAPWFFGRYGDRVIEPEIKLVFACLILFVAAFWRGYKERSIAVRLP